MGKDDRYHIRLLANASSDDSAKAHAWASAEVKRANIHSSRGEIAEVAVERSRDVKYSLCQLLAFAEQVAPVAFADENFVLFDVNEQSGKVEVGLSSAASVRDLSVETQKVGLPADGLLVYVAKAPTPTAVPWSALLRARPVVGGLDFGPKGCTTGIVGYMPSGQVAMFTAAHCSAVWGSVDGGTWRQNSNSANPLFGAETHDSEWPCYINGGWRRCDHIDLAGYNFTNIDLNAGEFDYEAGLIYRRVNRVIGVLGAGSPDIDTLYPRLVVTGMQEYPVMDQVVDESGGQSGWTYGTVYKTCTTTEFGGNSNNKMYCQDFARTRSIGGDSGAPMFVHYPNIPPSPGGNGISFLGIVWAKDSSVATGTVFGSVRQMRNELGNFYFY